MKEVKSPKKPLIYYYGIALLLIFLFNILVMPLIAQEKVKEVDYGTFMSMTEQKNIGKVEVQDSQIIFTDKKDKAVYKTGTMDDPTLTERLYESGAKFTKDIQTTMSPLLSGFLTHYTASPYIHRTGAVHEPRSLWTQAGGSNALAFGTGQEQC